MLWTTVEGGSTNMKWAGLILKDNQTGPMNLEGQDPNGHI